MWIADGWKDYELLDCGGGEKLERWGDQILVRPDPQAIWESDRKNRGWRTANARYSRSSTGGGHWDKNKLPESWPISYKSLRFQVKPMNFKHTGLFPEQAANWDFAMEQIRQAGRPIRVLNLFAYTGGATVACAAAGASVCHVDAAKGMVAWAKENARVSDSPLPEDLRRKIALFCNMEEDCVIQNLTASTLYEVPLLLEKEGLCRVACRKLGLPQREPDLAEWTALVRRINGVHKTVQIALVGKYTGLHDAYLSVVESLFHAGTACDAKVNIKWVDSEGLTAENVGRVLGDCSGVLVPGGFGDRGIEGMILAAQYARENDVPYFGICLGMQIAVIEYARHVAGWADAHSAEFSGLTAHPVIALMPDQVGVTAKGGTMRLGKYPCVLADGTLARNAYGTAEISERHRHRYEFNNQFRQELQDAGLRLAGLSPDGHLVEIVEEPGNTWFVGVQFHPEFKSRPNRPHPLFVGFVQASLNKQG